MTPVLSVSVRPRLGGSGAAACHHRVKPLAASLAVALACPLSAAADSGAGVDSVLGNALNPRTMSSVQEVDLQGLGMNDYSRSPSGLLNAAPNRVRDVGKTGGGWEYTGSAEVGVIGGADSKAQKFREYQDIGNGLYLNNFSLEMVQPDHAWFFETLGGGGGKDDRFYGLSLGRYNDWKVKAFYNETPHVYSTTFKPIYADNGSGRPVLNNGTVGGAGATTATALGAYAATLPDSQAEVVRKKGGIRLDLTLNETWAAYLGATQEHRQGQRPFGLQDSNVEGIEPINQKTLDLLAGLQYADKLTAMNLRASASLFANDIDVLYARRATTAADAAPTTLAAQDFSAYSLPPDNRAYNLKGEVSRRLPDFYKGRVSASFAWGSSRQDEALRLPLDPTASAAMAGNAGIPAAPASGNVAFNPNNWNGVNGSPLSRSSAGQRIDTALANFALALKPGNDWNLNATVRHYAADNKSGTYYAYNPLTGQWGPGIEQTTSFLAVAAPNANGLGGCQPAPGFAAPGGVGSCTATNAQIAALFGNARVLMAPPSSNKQTNYALSADYDLGHARSLDAALEREDYSHTYRERDKTWEDKLKLGYVDRSLSNATLRVSYEHDRKRGSFYDPLVTARTGQDWFTIYGVTFSRAALQDLLAKAGSGGIYPTLAAIQGWLLLTDITNSGGWMKPDQADRDQNILNARLNYAAREDLDLGATVQAKTTSYPSNARGPQKDDLGSLNLDLNYRPTAARQLSVFYSFLAAKQEQVENYGNVTATGFTNLTAYATSICGTLAANPSLATVDCLLNNQRIPSSDVGVDTRSSTQVFGFGATQEIRGLTFKANYVYSRGVTSIARIFGPTALSAAEQATEAAAGPYPDMKTVQHALELDLLMPIDKRTAVRFMFRLDSLAVRDWHYDYYPFVAPTTFIPADYGPQRYRVNTIGALLSFKL